MQLLLQQVLIQDNRSSHHGKKLDLFIENGIIHSIGENLSFPDHVNRISGHNLYVSLGWMDSLAHFCDPGEEHRETLHSGALAAAAGGFTDVLIVPNTKPSIDNGASIRSIYQRSVSLPINIHCMGAISAGCEGHQLAEMYELHQEGALAFSDGLHPVQDSSLLLKAMQYVLPTGKPIIQLPDDRRIAPKGHMHEGIVSTQLGIPARPSLQEELMVHRDIELLRYTGSNLHLTGISTRKSVDLIRAAKKQGLPLTASCTPWHLLFCDSHLESYETNLKLHTPLRTADDRNALIEGLLDGTIDTVASHHMPQHLDTKRCSFEEASFGAESLETVFPILLETVKDLDTIISILSMNPRSIFGLPLPTIEVGNKAILTVFDTTSTFLFDKSLIRSGSVNNPVLGQSLRGRVHAIVNGIKSQINQ
ncbi:MAG: dihydroorotase [Ferruginibacter sp.]